MKMCHTDHSKSLIFNSNISNTNRDSSNQNDEDCDYEIRPRRAHKPKVKEDIPIIDTLSDPNDLITIPINTVKSELIKNGIPEDIVESLTKEQILITLEELISAKVQNQKKIYLSAIGQTLFNIEAQDLIKSQILFDAFQTFQKYSEENKTKLVKKKASILNKVWPIAER